MELKKIRLNIWQKGIIAITASLIVIIQIIKFADDGIYGYGWIISFLVAGSLFFILFSTFEIKIKNELNLKYVQDLFDFSTEVTEKIYSKLIDYITYKNVKMELNRNNILPFAV